MVKFQPIALIWRLARPNNEPMGRKSSRSPEWVEDLARTVRERRKALKLTQTELAELAGCGPDFLYDVERAKPTLRLDKLLAVLDTLGLTLTIGSRAP